MGIAPGKYLKKPEDAADKNQENQQSGKDADEPFTHENLARPTYTHANGRRFRRCLTGRVCDNRLEERGAAGIALTSPSDGGVSPGTPDY